MNTTSHIELAKKLQALAKGGVGGEAANAERLLTKHMKKHGLTDADLDIETVSRHWFKFEHRFAPLFNQLTSNVIGVGSTIWKKHGREDNKKNQDRGVDCTVAQAIELELKLSFYSKAFDEEIRVLHHAFVLKHNLFDPNADKTSWDDLTEEQREQIRAARRMSESLKNRQLQKQIEG